MTRYLNPPPFWHVFVEEACARATQTRPRAPLGVAAADDDPKHRPRLAAPRDGARHAPPPWTPPQIASFLPPLLTTQFLTSNLKNVTRLHNVKDRGRGKGEGGRARFRCEMLLETRWHSSVLRRCAS